MTLRRFSKTLIIVVNDAGFFLSHRLPVALEAKKQGYEVHVVTAPSTASSEITYHGLTHHSLPLSRSGRNPFSELVALLALVRIFRAIRPAVVHLVTIKPVLYGGIAARLVGIPGVVVAISGLGSVFVVQGERAGLIQRAVATLYRIALNHRNLCVIFQNQEDRNTVLSMEAANPDQSVIIGGSGADLSSYAPQPEPAGTPIVVMAARLLLDKGVEVFVDSARILKDRGLKVRMQLVGDRDPGNPRSVTGEKLQQWKNEGVVELLGFREDMNAVFADSHIITLPSYYGEGLPKVLIEAAACGRAVVTTDHPGCRDAITPDETGLLVPVRDAEALANAIQYLIENPERRREMGRAGRKLAEEAFDVNKVVERHLEIYKELLTNVRK